MNTLKTIEFVPTKTKDSGVTRQLLQPTDYKVGMSIAELIRLSKSKNPEVSNSEISRFLTQFTGKHVRPQWVFNVLTNPPKGKK